MPLEVVIIGGGIIGCTTAYYLTRHPTFTPETVKVTLIEASVNGPAQGASGKAGGLVAKWAYPKDLVDISFVEHAKLAQEHNGTDRWGWRFVRCGSWEGRGSDPEADTSKVSSRVDEIKGGKSLEKTLGLDHDQSHAVVPKGVSRKHTGHPDDLAWVRADLTDRYSPMAQDGDTAQVHPYLFTTSMAALASDRGVSIIKGKALSIQYSKGNVIGVEYLDRETQTNRSIAASHVVLAAGAWSSSLLPSLPISATRAHSVTIAPPPGVQIAPYVLFTEITLPQQRARSVTVTPEIYARPNNEVYACGPGDDSSLPDCVDDVEVDQDACESVYQHVSSIAPVLREGNIRLRQACFLPTVSSTGGGGPMIGEADKIAKGLIIATGHTCWGICNAPGTALAISELVMEGKIKCGKLQKLHPKKFL